MPLEILTSPPLLSILGALWPAEAKKKMEEGILHRTAAAEADRQAKVGISQEIPPAEDIVDSIPEEEREAQSLNI